MTKRLALFALLAAALPAAAAVSATASRIDQTGNGATTAFAFTFPVTTSASHVEVLLDGVQQSSGYAVSLNANQTSSPGGTVTFTTAPANGKVVRIQRTIPVTQDLVLAPYSAFKAKTIEGALDKIVQQTQQVDRRTADAEGGLALASNGAYTSGLNRLTDLEKHTSGWVNVKSYGADPAASAAVNDAAFAAARTAAIASGCGLFIPGGTYNLSSPIALWDGATIRGSGRKKTVLSNAVSDVFNWTGYLTGVTISDLRVVASAGHIVNQGTANISLSAIRSVTFDQMATGKSVWHGDGESVMEQAVFIDMLVEDADFSIAAGATVAGWRLLGGVGGANSNTFRRLRVTGNGADVPWFEIENSNASTYAYDNTFEDITGEVCEGGIIDAKSVQGLHVSGVHDYDSTTYSRSIFKIGKSAAGPNSQVIEIANSGRRGGTLGAGAYDVEAHADTGLLRLSQVGPASGSASLSIPIHAEVTATRGSSAKIVGDAADGASAIGVILNNGPSFGTSGAKIVSFRHGNTEKANIDKDGGLTIGPIMSLAGVNIFTGTGAPSIDAAVGSLWLRTDGGAGTSLYVKQVAGAGAGNWGAK